MTINNPILIKTNGGFTLIEVLISALLLSLGIISVIKLQLSAFHTTQQSNFYSHAMQLANDMADKIRSNDAEIAKSGASNSFLKVAYNSNTGPPETASMCYARHCDPTQLAAAEIYEWLTRLNEVLPNARAVICRDDQPWDSNANNLSWDCAYANQASIVIKLGWTDKTDLINSSSPMLALSVSP
jgi:type IV pilus assembly protein PilV